MSLLGPVQAWTPDGELELGSRQRKAVLTVLAMRANQLVTKGELVDAVWGEAAPTNAYGSIHTHISALRKRLEPQWSRRSTGQVLVSARSGYSLRLGGSALDSELDVDRFHALRERARECRTARDSAGELAALGSALELWRGEALEDVSGPHAAWQRRRLTGLRLGTIERHTRLMINAGAQYTVIDDLDRLCRAHPLREEPHSLLMHALYLAGRRRDAIDVFHRLRTTTVERLGTEPSPRPSGLYDQILRDDPALWWTHDEPRGPARPIPLVVRHWPERTEGFVGREAEVAVLRAAASSVSAGTGGVVWLEGAGGTGKSALLAEGLVDTPGRQLAWSVADELGQRVALHTVLDGLDVTTLSPDPRRAELAALARKGEVGNAVDGTVSLVRKLCAAAPLILVVDQLQWADPESLHVLRHLRPETTHLPLLLVLACRPTPHRPEVERVRAAMSDAARTTAVTLGPLPARVGHG